MQTVITKLKITNEIEYPNLPFMTMDEDGTVFLIVKNEEGKYCPVNLTDGFIPDMDEYSFETINEYFKKNSKEKIVESQIIIKV